MNTDTIYLVINALLYFITFAVYQRKIRRFTVVSALLLFYGISAAVAVHLFNHPLSSGIFKEITLLPLLYLYGMLILTFSPLFKTDRFYHKEIERPSPLVYNVFCILIIVIMLMNIGQTFRNFGTTFNSMIMNSDAAADIYDDIKTIAKDTGSGISNLLSVLQNLFADFPIFLLIYQLTQPKKNVIITIGLILAALVSPMTSITVASRGALVNFLIGIAMWYIFMRPWISRKTKRYFGIISLSLLSVFMVAFLLITNSRFSKEYMEEDYALYSLENYYGQPFLNFDNYGLDAGGIRYGDRTATGIKGLFVGFDNVPKNYVERVLKYNQLKINETSFYTFVGDFTIDFGPVFAALIFIVFALFFRSQLQINGNKIPFHKLIIVYLLISILCKGLPLFPYSNIIGNLKLLLFIVVYWYFHIDYNISRK